MTRALIIVALLLLVPRDAFAANRLVQADALNRGYRVEMERYVDVPEVEEPTAADWIKTYESWPGWKYVPQFVELIKQAPDDDAAFRCCLWIIDRTGQQGNQHRVLFEAEQFAWTVLSAYHIKRGNVANLCLAATQCHGPAQEKYVRDLARHPGMSREETLLAAITLGELLANKVDAIEGLTRRSPTGDFEKYLDQQKSPKWGRDLLPENGTKFKTEAMQWFKRVSTSCADVPTEKTLKERADNRLYALEHLTIGAEAPDIAGTDLKGKPLRLRDYRGRVVVVSFWSTGSSPCVSMIQQQAALLAAYKGRPVAVLSVCCDSHASRAQTTVTANGMTWPCWLDGSDGPIASNYNISEVPAVFVLDPQGRIAAKNLRGRDLETQVSEMLKSAR